MEDDIRDVDLYDYYEKRNWMRQDSRGAKLMANCRSTFFETLVKMKGFTEVNKKTLLKVKENFAPADINYGELRAQLRK